MPRLKKVPCAHCDAKMVPETSFCPNCEQPTVWASHDERTEWELRQWSQKRASRPKRRASADVAEVTPIRSRRISTPGPSKPVVKHPAARVVEPAARLVPPSKARPPRATKPITERVAPPATAEKKQVARSKPEPARAPARKAARRSAAVEVAVTVAKSKAQAAPGAQKVPAAPPTPAAPSAPEAPAVMPPAVDLSSEPPVGPDHAAEQTELLRELLQHVISIEEKINGHGTGLSRRLRLLKR